MVRIPVLLFLLGISHLTSAQSTGQNSSDPSAFSPDSFSSVSLKQYPGYREVTESIRGQLKSTRYTTLSAGMSGTLLDFPVRPGSLVKEGDLLARFDCRAEEAERSVVVAKKQGAAARHEVNKKLSEFDNVSGLELSLSQAELAMAESELKLIDVRLSHCEIRAPFTGQVINKQFQQYQFVPVGEPLLELVDTEQLEVEMVLQSAWLGRLNSGDHFSITLDETGESVSARIDRIVGSVDPVSQTVRVIGSLETSGSGLLPGMSGEVVMDASLAGHAP